MLAYFEFKAVQWITLSTNHGHMVLPELEEGLCVYAKNQAQLLCDMAKSFEAKWAVLQGRELMVEELKQLLHPQEHRSKKVNDEAQDCNELGGEGMASEDEGIEVVEDADEVLFD